MLVHSKFLDLLASHALNFRYPVLVRSIFFSCERQTAFLILDIVEGHFSGTKILDRGCWSVTEWAIEQEKEKN